MNDVATNLSGFCRERKQTLFAKGLDGLSNDVAGLSGDEHYGFESREATTILFIKEARNRLQNVHIRAVC